MFNLYEILRNAQGGQALDNLATQFGISPAEADAAVKERLATLGFAPVGGTREQFGAFIRSEIAKWGKAITASGAKVN